MAMMMTGRVLLVCVLCALWCGAGGGYAWDFGSESLNEHYYGANGAFCKILPKMYSCELRINASKLQEAASQKNNTQSGTGTGQPNAGGSSGRQDQTLEESGSGQPEGTAGEGTQASQPPGEGGTETPTPLSSPPTATATATAAQTSATRTPDESDGSTAASHSTSPLLLLLVACAAAAAVVAA
ncbi:Mucin-associated surface protein (MASP) [Trypanosoma cruzi]|uniref:Mucin-associated surface protein (MASP), putative n=2 Tax=Trypanosoma cruzi TaxID=5693 RepID=Q4D9L0_TRYCC|nr:mucin-associated surface protein (MASP), putative [Trypanosoma cruzi]EAN89202.1 mucin-associated surface protein (MASP), putative [Trypanosoma cruzi]PWV06445.1 Mucin-associated surface protein (MASP) [Trypanosoma cruzi]|eukprot:XP_811053.1 mucin-associated surface protein (MASP) [Trypanosoma cruzi strain CL Brener]